MKFLYSISLKKLYDYNVRNLKLLPFQIGIYYPDLLIYKIYEY